MNLKKLIKELEKLPQEKMVICQVVGLDNSLAWNMFYRFNDISNSDLVQLEVYHPHLKKLPDVEFKKVK